VVLTIVGALCLLLSCLYQETLSDGERYEGTILGSLSRLVAVGKNAGFLVPCLIFSLYQLAFMGYIAMSSYIYVDVFELSEQMYSYFFAANAALSTVGPMLYVRFMTGFNKKKFAMTCFVVYVICGAFLICLGGSAPFLFWLGFAPFSLVGTISRPFSTNIMLDQQEGDTGSASSLINGVSTIFGSVGMVCASMWSDIVFGLGIIIFASGVVSIIGWLLLMRSAVPCRGVK
jgi:DHA1 family bicyclomycin/chloramphenicol resistance-like MFS transporter